MKAVQILGDMSSPQITTTASLPQPVPQGTDLLVRVHAAGITGDEVTWPEVYARTSRIPGHDISGVISALGPEYTGPLTVGQEVYVCLHPDRGAGQAEYAVCSAQEVAPKPKSVSFAEASALPIPLLTAWEALTSRGNVTAGMRVLITGASGAVGILAVQLATRVISGGGAHVIALASARNHDDLKNLGAQEVVDYNTPGWENLATGKVDVVFDTVGGEVLAKTWESVKEDGLIITVGDPAPSWAFGGKPPAEAETHPRVRYLHFIVSPNAERLEEGARMIDEGSLRPLAAKGFPFEQAQEAWAYAQTRSRGHKVAIEFA